MHKSVMLTLVLGTWLIGSSMAALITQPQKPTPTRRVAAGKAFLTVPLHLPGEVLKGTAVSGCVLLGSKDECDITYDRFSGVYWSDRAIPGSALLPTPAYHLVSERAGAPVDLGSNGRRRARTIKISAEKPCGKVVEENLTVIDLYCGTSATHYAVTGMQDPFMTPQKVADMAGSLKCP
jgi:hypothetical protein